MHSELSKKGWIKGNVVHGNKKKRLEPTGNAHLIGITQKLAFFCQDETCLWNQ
jgi:hypothetical protein